MNFSFLKQVLEYEKRKKSKLLFFAKLQLGLYMALSLEGQTVMNFDEPE